jgi:transcription initiation factor TFIID TATA-box-binding protein
MEILNIVASVKFPFGFDLEKIQKTYDFICSRSPGFPAVNLKIENSDLCQVFANGSVIVLGQTSTQRIQEMFIVYAGLLEDLGYPCTGKEDLKIQNIVARFVYHSKVDLFDLAVCFALEYEPEVFPAARYRDKELGITANIFRSGKCILLGGKRVEFIEIVAEKIKRMLEWSEYLLK